MLVAFPLGDPLSASASAAPPWALFGRFAGTTGSPDFPRSSITGLRPQPSPHDPPPINTAGDRGISRFSRLETPRMHRFLDPAGSDDGSRKRRHRCCLPLSMTASASRVMSLRGSIAQPAPTPTDASPPPSRAADARLGAIVVSLLLRCRAFSSPSPDRFIPALHRQGPQPGATSCRRSRRLTSAGTGWSLIGPHTRASRAGPPRRSRQPQDEASMSSPGPALAAADARAAGRSIGPEGL